MSLRSFGFVRFIRAIPGVRRVRSGWLGSFGRALEVIRARPGGRRGHSGSLVSFVGALDIVLFRWVHSGAPWGSSGSFGFVGALLRGPSFIRVRWFL